MSTGLKQVLQQFPGSAASLFTHSISYWKDMPKQDLGRFIFREGGGLFSESLLTDFTEISPFSISEFIASFSV